MTTARNTERKDIFTSPGTSLRARFKARQTRYRTWDIGTNVLPSELASQNETFFLGIIAEIFIAEWQSHRLDGFVNVKAAGVLELPGIESLEKI